jgi:16S rRNA (guanine966-N2)-methyltransferase
MQNEVKIIAGKWRGRKIHFLPENTLRPTPSRVRETIFNWLAPEIVGARCLDLFAGSGILCFEALLRGAEEVMALEINPKNSHRLNENAKEIGEVAESHLEIVQTDCLKWLKNSSPSIFDIVFVDPPFDLKVGLECFNLLENYGWLQSTAWISHETNEPISEDDLPENWTIWRNKRAGQVYYMLFKRQLSAA